MAQILVITNSYDNLHVEAVRKEVEALGSTLTRFDVDLLVKGQNQITFDYKDGLGAVSLSTPDEGTFEIADIDTLWLRKPFGFGNFGFVESIKDPVQRGAVAKEVGAVMNALFSLLSDRLWPSSIAAMERAQSKPYQLSIAQRVGLNVPNTIITSDPVVARSFCRVDRRVFKPLVESALNYEERSFLIETTLLTDAHMRQLDLIKHQPSLFQAYIDKRCELRVTYVSGELFVARQELTSSASKNIVDWRTVQGTSDSIYAPGELTAETARRLTLFMRELQLGFGALDFAVDQDGKEFFLEVNPKGQWLGYTDEIGLPAAATIARCLVNRTSGYRFEGR